MPRKEIASRLRTSSANGVHRLSRIEVNKRVRQNFGLGLENGAVSIFVTGKIHRKLLVTAPAEFKELADGDLLKLQRLSGREHSGI